MARSNGPPTLGKLELRIMQVLWQHGATTARQKLFTRETALATALNVSYMAEQISIFSIVVGVALILTGIGLVILAFAVFGRDGARKEALGT